MKQLKLTKPQLKTLGKNALGAGLGMATIPAVRSNFAKDQRVSSGVVALVSLAAAAYGLKNKKTEIAIAGSVGTIVGAISTAQAFMQDENGTWTNGEAAINMLKYVPNLTAADVTGLLPVGADVSVPTNGLAGDGYGDWTEGDYDFNGVENFEYELLPEGYTGSGSGRQSI